MSKFNTRSAINAKITREIRRDRKLQRTRLNKAAPDLLEACRGGLSQIRMLEKLMEDFDYIRNLFEKAIAKTEGRK